MGTSAENCTWEEIKAISEAGKADEYFNLGDEKTIPLTGGTEVVMQIVAFDADEKADGTGTAGITWISKGIVTTHDMNGQAAGGWETSGMRSWLQGTFYNTLPSDVQSAIVSVSKTYHCYSSSWLTKTCADNVWIPSYREIYGGTSHEASGADYTSFFTDADARTKYTSGGTATRWLSRSISRSNNTSWIYVREDGINGNIGAGTSLGVALGFCT